MNIQEDRTVSVSLEVSSNELEVLIELLKRVTKDADSFDPTSSDFPAEAAEAIDTARNPLDNLRTVMFARRMDGVGGGDPDPGGDNEDVVIPSSPPVVVARAITVEQEDVIDGSSPQRMFTKASLWMTGPLAGRLKAKTRTWTGIDLRGFTGGVRIGLLNANGDLVAITHLYSFGVDGDSWLLPGGPSDRTDGWDEQFDPDVIALTTQLVIEHEHSGKNRLQSIMREAVKYKEIVVGAFV
jgi:hypothetical protein